MESVLTPELTAELERAEKAIDECGLFKRTGEAEFHASRLGYTVSVQVKLLRSRKKPCRITGTGDTLEAATEHLVEHLDIWAQAIV